jgi:hypothetical protein
MIREAPIPTQTHKRIAAFVYTPTPFFPGALFGNSFLLPVVIKDGSSRVRQIAQPEWAILASYWQQGF